MGQKEQYCEELKREEHTRGNHMGWLPIQSTNNSMKALSAWNVNESSQSWKKHLLWFTWPSLKVFPLRGGIYIVSSLCGKEYQMLGICEQTIQNIMFLY